MCLCTSQPSSCMFLEPNIGWVRVLCSNCVCKQQSTIWVHSDLTWKHFVVNFWDFRIDHRKSARHHPQRTLYCSLGIFIPCHMHIHFKPSIFGCVNVFHTLSESWRVVATSAAMLVCSAPLWPFATRCWAKRNVGELHLSRWMFGGLPENHYKHLYHFLDPPWRVEWDLLQDHYKHPFVFFKRRSWRNSDKMHRFCSSLKCTLDTTFVANRLLAWAWKHRAPAFYSYKTMTQQSPPNTNSDAYILTCFWHPIWHLFLAFYLTYILAFYHLTF